MTTALEAIAIAPAFFCAVVIILFFVGPWER
jgi:hypothetical protein